MRNVVVLVAALAGLAMANRARFDDHRVYRLQPVSQEQVDALRGIQARSSALGISFWTDVYNVNGTVDIMVSPQSISYFEKTLQASGLYGKICVRDVQKLIDKEQPKRKSHANSFGWDQYYDLDKIHAWLRSLGTRYPTTVTVVQAGKSYEGRDILGVKVSYKTGNKAVFIEGGIHAREWISPATVTYILDQLLTSKNSSVRSVAESFDWYIFPNTNPDGYVYTFTTNRLWRKSRRYIGVYEGSKCYGVDLNRNWGFHWNEGVDNSTITPCSETYSGPSAFSEVETSYLSKYISNIAGNLHIYVSFHSYGQKILVPYGIYNIEPSNENALLAVGRAAANSLAQLYGTTYTVGSIINIEYVAPGSSVDWVRGTADVQFAFAYELRDTGEYGFLLPAAQIVPTGRETLDSVITLVSQAGNYNSQYS